MTNVETAPAWTCSPCHALDHMLPFPHKLLLDEFALSNFSSLHLILVLSFSLAVLYQSNFTHHPPLHCSYQVSYPPLSSDLLAAGSSCLIQWVNEGSLSLHGTHRLFLCSPQPAPPGNSFHTSLHLEVGNCIIDQCSFIDLCLIILIDGFWCTAYPPQLFSLTGLLPLCGVSQHPRWWLSCKCRANHASWKAVGYWWLI